MSERNTSASSKRYWKSLEQYDRQKNGLEPVITDEFTGADIADGQPQGSSVSRRTFMGLLSASMAVAATACRRPDDKIVPSVKAVEYMTPGLPNWFTTVWTNGASTLGLLVKSREGRPVKIEGNDMHSTSMGKTNRFAQATLLQLYDPDRMQGARRNDGTTTTANAISAVAEGLSSATAAGKQAFVLIGEHPSPSLHAVTAEIAAMVPGLNFVHVPAFLYEHQASVNAACLGVDARFVVDLSKADAILAVDADIFGSDENDVMNIRGFSARRKPTKDTPDMNKLIVAESVFSITGSTADRRIVLKPSEYEAFLSGVLKAVAEIKGSADLSALASAPAASEDIKATAKDLCARQGVVVVGAHLSEKAQALAIAINTALGAYKAGGPIDPRNDIPYSNSKKNELQNFRSALKSGQVGAVLFVEVNAEYKFDAELKSLLAKVEERYAFSMYEDETVRDEARKSKVKAFVPLAHYLESWGDALAFDGTLSIQQPMIAPLNSASLSIGDALIALGKKLNPALFADKETYRDVVIGRWQAYWDGTTADDVLGDTFNKHWEQALRTGVYKPRQLAKTRTELAISLSSISMLASSGTTSVQGKNGGIAISIKPSYQTWDGSFANLGWLQELPDPVTRTTWDNLAVVGIETAKALGVTTEDIVEVKTDHGSIELPVLVEPGVAEGVLATVTGYGRTSGGVVLAGIGSNAWSLIGPAEPVSYHMGTVKKVEGKRHRLARTQEHFDLRGRSDLPLKFDERKIVRETDLSTVKKGEELFERQEVPGRSKENRLDAPLSISGEYQYKGHRWGMVIDLSSCVGCSACVVACQAENNIFVVGKEQVALGREMHWIRIDRYYRGETANPEVVLQPMLCQHCEQAPCENVCPVAATTHSPEGLNEMTYNRCVGTRYCMNNCPYKVRRFNYLHFQKEKRSPLDLVFNPSVTMRMRGVMEKCTFCVQRINEAKFKAKDNGLSRVADGAFKVACEEACPANAILFGDTNNQESAVAKQRRSDRGFLVLEELNTRPQITYLAKVRNDLTA